MLRTALSILKNQRCVYLIHTKSFLTNAYRCNDAWRSRTSSPILQKIDLDDLYTAIDQNHSSKGVMSAIDVDIFANSVNEGSYLDELRDLIHRLRLTADTGNTLPSTHYAAIRSFVEHGRINDLLNILWDPLNYGIFLDEFTANILMDELLNKSLFDKAAIVASLVMLQEEFENEITCALALYSSYKFVLTHKHEPTEKPQEEIKGKKPKVDEIKIRIKYLRNPFFDDHFDLTDHILRAGKTLAWIAEKNSDNLHCNLQMLGWFYYKKYDKLLSAAEELSKNNSAKAYKEVVDILSKHQEQGEAAKLIDDCTRCLSNMPKIEHSLEDDLKVLIENAINKTQQNDIQQQEQMFKTWEKLREEKLEAQTKRLDHARRVQLLEEKQNLLKEQEQKLWFFDNQEKYELEIKEKYASRGKKRRSKKRSKANDDDYIPPEILPKPRS